MAEKQAVYGFVTRLPKNDNEIGWKTTGFVGFNPEGTYQYEFSESMGWKQPVFTKLDWEFFQKKPDDYRCEAISGRDARPQRPQREEVQTAPAKPIAPEVPKLEIPAVEKPKSAFEPKRMGRPPKPQSETVQTGA